MAAVTALVAAVVLLSLSSCASSTKKPWASLTNCPGCISAGYGWSTKKHKCGPGFLNKKCLPQPLSQPRPPPKSPPPPPVAQQQQQRDSGALHQASSDQQQQPTTAKATTHRGSKKARGRKKRGVAPAPDAGELQWPTALPALFDRIVQEWPDASYVSQELAPGQGGVVQIKNFINSEEGARLIKVGTPKLQSSSVRHVDQSADTEVVMLDETRVSETAWISHHIGIDQHLKRVRLFAGTHAQTQPAADYMCVGLGGLQNAPRRKCVRSASESPS
jgi:hypothetical protein